METLTLNSSHTYSLAERAARLEQFEIAEAQRLQAEAEARAEALQARLDTLERQPVETAADPVQQAIEILQGHQQSAARLIAAEHQLDLFGRENDELQRRLAQLDAERTQLRSERDHYQRECEQMLAKHNQVVDKAEGALVLKDRQLGLLNAELKELRALNPQRQAKKIKELQKKVREQTDAIAELRKTASENARIRKEWEERGRVIDKLYAENRKLDIALEKACEDMNNGAKPLALERHGDWEFFGHNDGNGALVIHHEPSDFSFVYRAGVGSEPFPTLPDDLAEKAEATIARYRDLREGMTDYAGGEAVSA